MIQIDQREDGEREQTDGERERERGGERAYESTTTGIKENM